VDSKVMVGGTAVAAKNEDVVDLIATINRVAQSTAAAKREAAHTIKDLELDAGIVDGTGDDLFGRLLIVLASSCTSNHQSIIKWLDGSLKCVVEAAEPPVKTFEQQADDFKEKLEAAMAARSK